jgi:hypothetical protein
VCFICKDWAHVARSDVQELDFVCDSVCKVPLKVKSILGTFSRFMFLLIFNVLNISGPHSYLHTMVM